MHRYITVFAVLLLTVLPAAPVLAQHYSHLTEPAYKGSPPQNCSCHAGSTGRLGKLDLWKNTLHAKAYDSVAAAATVQNTIECLHCHTTGWDTTQHIGGFSDFYLHTPRTASDSAGMLRMKNVQCESCHKPYAVGAAYDTSLVAEKCADCHKGNPHSPNYEDWSKSKHAQAKYTSIPGGAFQFIPSNPNCAGCHTAEGFIQWASQTGVSPNVVPADTTKSATIACAACHNPHGSSNEHQLRLPLVQICEKCHNPQYPVDSVNNAVNGEVHNSTAYMFEGKGGYQYAGFTYNSSPHTFVVVNKCVTCHVHMTPFVNDTLPAYTGHTFTPHKGACKSCHGDLDTSAANPDVFDYRRTQTICDSLANVLNTRLASAKTHADSTSQGFLRARFNFNFYTQDGSHGIHNTQYAKALLLSSIQNFSLTSVEPVPAATPLTYALQQNYPNPFNPSTVIAFSVPRGETVRLDVYDVTGRYVATLLNEELAPGTYRVAWDGNDAHGTRVASGLYFYKMQAGGFVSTKKMLMVK